MALDFFAGCVGGCAGVAVGYPLDTVKVRLQTQDAKNPKYRGTFHCLQSIVQQESARGLFKGMSSPLASVAVINAMIFGIYGNVQRRLNDPDSLKSHALAGSVAGFVQSFVCSPMELVKTRLQIQENMCTNGVQLYKGPLDCVKQIWNSEGIRGIYRGLGITVAREIPAFGLYFSSYEFMTRQSGPSKPVGTLHMMAAGGMAGVFSWLFTYPIDFLKSRLQVDGLGGTRSYDGIRDCVMKIYREAGIRGFFPGMTSTLIRSFPVNAVTFSVVTWILRWASPLEEKESGVSYHQDASALLIQDSFSHDHQLMSTWTAEWNQLGFRIVLTNSGPSSAPLLRKYNMQCMDALSSYLHHSRPPPSSEHVASINSRHCCSQEADQADNSPPSDTKSKTVCPSCHKVLLGSVDEHPQSSLNLVDLNSSKSLHLLVGQGNQ